MLGCEQCRKKTRTENKTGARRVLKNNTSRNFCKNRHFRKFSTKTKKALFFKTLQKTTFPVPRKLFETFIFNFETYKKSRQTENTTWKKVKKEPPVP